MMSINKFTSRKFHQHRSLKIQAFVPFISPFNLALLKQFIIMLANISKILIIGATSGIGEGFAKYYHSKGKTVIVAGRRFERLSNLKSDLHGLEIIQLDVEDLGKLESNIEAILKAHPDLDSVLPMAGKMEYFNLTDLSSSTTKSIISEATTNLIAPMIITRILVPHFQFLNRPTTLITVSSGLGYIPVNMWPVYNATKAGIHAFSVSLRSQTAVSNVHVIELAPPYVDTALDDHFREKMIKQLGDHAQQPMMLEEYMERTTDGMNQEGVKEVASGFGELGVTTWRNAFGPILEAWGQQG
jgi:uncharacterized oxidoreductase